MKILVGKMLSLTIALAGAVSLHAQAVTAKVPFNFYVGKTAMTAGAYHINAQSSSEVVTLNNGVSFKATATGRVMGAGSDERPRLVFHRYGDTYFLAEVWNGHGTMGRVIARTPLEKELAANTGGGSNAVVALEQ